MFGRHVFLLADVNGQIVKFQRLHGSEPDTLPVTHAQRLLGAPALMKFPIEEFMRFLFRRTARQHWNHRNTVEPRGNFSAGKLSKSRKKIPKRPGEVTR